MKDTLTDRSSIRKWSFSRLKFIIQLDVINFKSKYRNKINLSL